ncbi:MAG: hypothetical protein ABIJ09_03520 [Pseudomonadota bacterium]
MAHRLRAAKKSDDATNTMVQALCSALAVNVGGGPWRAERVLRETSCHTFRARASRQSDRLVRLTRDRSLLEQEAPALRVVARTHLALEPQATLKLDEPGDLHAGVYGAHGVLELVTEPDLSDLAALFATLHDMPTLGLMRSFPVQDKPGVLVVLQRLVEQQRSYLHQREWDGLPQDMLALQLADLGRVVRRYVVAQEHHCQPHPRRALCHGAASPSTLVRDREGLHLVGWEHARIGDAARDLAQYAVAAGLSEDGEARLLELYLDSRAQPDHRFIPRYHAHRELVVLERPVLRLLRLYRIKRQGSPVIDSVLEVLRREVELATHELATALTALNAFVGRGRPIAPRDVASMGRLVTHEEFLLGDVDRILAVEGASYTGKTPTASLLATRLHATYLNPAVLVRTGLALGGPGWRPADLAQVLAVLDSHEVEVEALAQAPYYRVHVDGEDLTEAAREPELYPAQRRFFQDEANHALLRTWLGNHLKGRVVLDGEQLDGLLGPAVRRVFLTCDDEVREQRRQEHVADGAADLALDPSPRIPDSALVIDSSRSEPAQTALNVIQALLSETQRAEILVADFTGRRPLFER